MTDWVTYKRAAAGCVSPTTRTCPSWVDGHVGLNSAVSSTRTTLQPLRHLMDYRTHFAWHPAVGHFQHPSPLQWDPTMKPALEILKCEGWSATAFHRYGNADVRQRRDQNAPVPAGPTSQHTRAAENADTRKVGRVGFRGIGIRPRRSMTLDDPD